MAKTLSPTAPRGTAAITDLLCGRCKGKRLVWGACTSCSGSGRSGKSDGSKCPDCYGGGRGWVSCPSC
jgi:predicted amidophosphoribosyltransferase